MYIRIYSFTVLPRLLSIAVVLNASVLSAGLLTAGLPAAGLAQTMDSKPFYGDYHRGWYWHEKLPIPEKTEKKKEKSQPASNTPAGGNKPTASERISDLKKKLEEAKALAVLEPTPEHLRSYMALQKVIVDQAGVFARSWMQVLAYYPELDETIKNPVAQNALHLKHDLDRKENTKLLQKLSKTHGLFFFFKGACPYCHEMAPVVQDFAKRYGFEVIYISLDGGKLNAVVPQAQLVSGNHLAMNVETVPAVFLVNTKTQAIMPVAHGYTAQDQMIERIKLLSSQEKESRL